MKRYKSSIEKEMRLYLTRGMCLSFEIADLL